MTYLAIGSTTKALVELLKKKLNKPPLLGAGVTIEVTTLPPDDDRLGENTGINLYLYRIVESPFFKNTEYRGDRSNPFGGARPPLAVTLHYLVTAYAKKVANSFLDDIIAQQVLGNAMSILHDFSVLNDVHDADFDADLDQQFPAELHDSFEKIKVMLVPTSIDEFSKIWTGLSKAYRLSVAYEVSLVEIAPSVPARLPAPPPREAVVRASPFQLPSILEIDPASGPAGSEVTLRGSAFARRGLDPIVTFGSVEITGGDLVRASDTEIVFTVPDSVVPGPRVPVTVSVQGRSSEPRVFEVTPWIGSVVPLRGPTMIPLRLGFEVPPAETVTASVDGNPATASVDAATKSVLVTVPSLAANGPKPVVLTLTGSGARTNAVTFEVVPRITGVTLTPAVAPVRTTISVQGQRLDGQDVYVRYSGILVHKGENVDPASVEVVLERALAPGEPVSVIVDGSESDEFPPRVDRLDPAAAAAGDLVTLTGSGLSGGAVEVDFGSASVVLGAQPFSHSLTVAVPTGIAPGSVDVHVTVDGTETNSIPLLLSA